MPTHPFRDSNNKEGGANTSSTLNGNTRLIRCSSYQSPNVDRILGQSGGTMQRQNRCGFGRIRRRDVSPFLPHSGRRAARRLVVVCAYSYVLSARAALPRENQPRKSVRRGGVLSVRMILGFTRPCCHHSQHVRTYEYVQNKTTAVVCAHFKTNLLMVTKADLRGLLCISVLVQSFICSIILKKESYTRMNSKQFFLLTKAVFTCGRISTVLK